MRRYEDDEEYHQVELDSRPGLFAWLCLALTVAFVAVAVILKCQP